jgi:hypothetical protein
MSEVLSLLLLGDFDGFPEVAELDRLRVLALLGLGWSGADDEKAAKG